MAAFNSFLITPGSYGTKQGTVGPNIISLRKERQMQRLACKQKCLFSQINDEMQLSSTSPTKRNALHRNTNVEHKKMKRKPSRCKRRFDTCLNFKTETFNPPSTSNK
ncbi:hypothetical protein AVEN_153769-1 [Araneus ventricosus]|uniref:Uncharacterized protein n=1 Tax=Araneus ventricosus TaxID=182803 RepID=A0A4Y2JY55_ARAVE|nr:hypothetical protein AVEN_153769-1 [Araneus ventricosus]